MRQIGFEHFTLAGPDGGRLRLEELEAQTEEQFYLFEREDDWCATAYFYLDRPVSAMPALVAQAERVAGLV